MKEELYEQIEAYLGGDMSSEEQIQFELKMSKDPILAQEVRLSNQVNHHLNEQSWLHEEFKNNEAKKELEEFMRSDEAAELKLKLEKVGEKYQENVGSSNLKYILGAVAAILVVVLLSTQFWRTSPSNTQLYQKYYTEMDLPSLVKRGSENEALTKGIVAFKTKKYNDAISNFKSYMASTKGKDPLPYAYIGFSHLELNQLDKALTNFDSLLYSNTIDSSRGLWYKSLAYLKNGKIEEAKKVLNEILKDSLNFNFNKAKKIMPID